jgi:hypothetical protein
MLDAAVPQINAFVDALAMETAILKFAQVRKGAALYSVPPRRIV